MLYFYYFLATNFFIFKLHYPADCGIEMSYRMRGCVVEELVFILLRCLSCIRRNVGFGPASGGSRKKLKFV